MPASAARCTGGRAPVTAEQRCRLDAVDQVGDVDVGERRDAVRHVAEQLGGRPRATGPRNIAGTDDAETPGTAMRCTTKQSHNGPQPLGERSVGVADRLGVDEVAADGTRPGWWRTTGGRRPTQRMTGYVSSLAAATAASTPETSTAGQTRMP